MYTHSSIKKVTPSQWFFIFCCLHIIVWTAIPAYYYPNPPTDSVEGVAWGNLWLWGYEKHPFLAPWVTAFFTNLLGAIGWPIYLLGQLSVVACFAALWKLGNKILSSSWPVFIAIGLLEGIHYYNVQAASFDPNVLMLPLWAWATFLFYQALTERKIKWWFLLGVFAGLSMLAKYESVLLFGVMLIFLLSSREGRSVFKSAGIYVAFLVSILVFMPNLVWLFHHHFDAIFYATQEMEANKTAVTSKFILVFYHPIRFLIEQITVILPAFLLFIPFYKKRNKAENLLLPFDQRFLLFFGWGPLLLTLLMSFFSDAALVSRWAFPFFSITGLWCVARWSPMITRERLQIFTSLIVFWNLILLLGTMFVFVFQPSLTGKITHYEFFPGENVATALTQQWHQTYRAPLPYVVGTHNIVVNVSAFSGDKPIPFFEANSAESPWVDNKDLCKKGGVFVLDAKDKKILQTQIAALKATYPHLQAGSVQTFPYLTSAKVAPAQLWVAFLPPAP